MGYTTVLETLALEKTAPTWSFQHLGLSRSFSSFSLSLLSPSLSLHLSLSPSLSCWEFAIMFLHSYMFLLRSMISTSLTRMMWLCQARRFVLIGGGWSGESVCNPTFFQMGVWGRCKPPSGVRGKRILATIYWKLAKNQVSESPSTPQLLKCPWK